MKKICILTFIFFAASSCKTFDSESDSKFYSADSFPVTIAYETKFQIALSEFPEAVTSDPHGTVHLSADNENFVNETLRLHILHLHGVFTYHKKPHNFSKYSGTIEESYQELGTKITNLERTRGHLIVSYQYMDRGIFYKDLIPNGTGRKLKFHLPVEPRTIYAKGMPPNPAINPVTNEPINPCTDTNDNSEDAFWYYWSPQRPGCPASFLSHLNLVEAEVKVLPSTSISYPEYQMIYQRNLVRINILVGSDEKMDDPKDAGRLTYEELRKQFEQLSQKDGKPIFTKSASVQSDFENYHYTYKNDQFDTELSIYFVDTNNDQHWDSFAADKLVNSDILIFSGHSYEGYYFDPDRLFDSASQQMTGNRYQVLFFNACTTWSYYSRSYFDLKRRLNEQDGRATEDPIGTKYLDIVTNAIGAPFTVDGANPTSTKPLAETILVTSLLGLTEKGLPRANLRSWQAILNRITALAGYDFTALTNVIGDEDNPKKLAPGIKVPQSMP